MWKWKLSVFDYNFFSETVFASKYIGFYQEVNLPLAVKILHDM